ncbi:protein phosphatase 2C domain-containing protein [Microlunatus parietis]|uniref:Protein phosphatase n=1 Tax=Microlunatus parietis TaxID=682979 RepID=A0A7Y9I886_9ACTN|nr:protein phosphatase 2C domain-containing protein [Microlunatus parietis]NYE71997.1 protein phosphatase [Microlunatus parietis]
MTRKPTDSETTASARRAKSPTEPTEPVDAADPVEPDEDVVESDLPTETIVLPDLAEQPATEPAEPYGLRYVAHSEIGLIRKNNQDSGYVSPRLLLVADGMGGAAAGDLASAIAVDSVRHADAEVQPERELTALAEAIRAANDRISDFIAADFSLEGMGTTVTGGLFDGHSLALAHIGDSRAYLFRDGALERLTHDHSWVQSLVDEGKISEAEAAVHPHRSLLVKVLNGQPAADPDLTTVELRLGDRLLLCSDGLCGLVEDDQLAIALAEPDLHTSMERMVEAALTEGGIDNITVVVADVVDSDPDDRVLVLGAAAEREIPAIPPRPDRAERDFGDEDDLVDPMSEDAVEADDSDDEARYAPQAPSRRRLLRPLIGILALVVLLAGAVAAGYAWTRTQFFVGAADDQVAIFQGLPDPVPGLSLSTVYEVQPLALSALPSAYQDQVRSNIEVADLTAARQTVARLSEAAGQGKTEDPEPPTTPPNGTPSATPSSSAPPASPPASSSCKTPGGTASPNAGPGQPC